MQLLKVGLLSDTHGYLDDSVYKYFSEVDEVWHAGDIGTLDIIDKLESFKKFRAVYGNIDGQEIRVRTNKNQLIIHGENRVLITHIAGKPGKYSTRVQKLIKDYKPTILICGHSHFLKVENDKRFNLLHMNPGAAGRHGFHKIRTMLRFSLTPEKITNLEAIELGKRSALTG